MAEGTVINEKTLETRETIDDIIQTYTHLDVDFDTITNVNIKSRFIQKRNNTPDPNETIYDYDFMATSTGTTSFGTVTCAVVVAGNTVIINGLTYTAINGTPAVDGEFQRVASNSVTADNLRDAINNDTRIGDLGSTPTFPSGLLAETTGGDIVNVFSVLPGNDGQSVVITQVDSELATTPFVGGDTGFALNVVSREFTTSGKDFEWQLLDNFFTDGNVFNNHLFALPKRNRHNEIDYNIFFTYSGATIMQKMALFYGNLTVPEGTNTANFPVWDNSTFTPIAGTIVKRSTQNGSLTYDYFIIALD